MMFHLFLAIFAFIAIESGLASIHTHTTIERERLIPTSQEIKVVKVEVPMELLLNNDRDCPRLQEMGDKLLNDPEYCDLNIEVVDPVTNISKIFCAHKSVLCMRSSALREKIRGLVGRLDPGQKHQIKLKGIKPMIFKNLLKFIYTDKLWPDFNLKENIMELYLSAQILNITDLTKLAEEHLYSSVTINEASNYLQWAQTHRLGKIKKFILNFARTTLNMDKAEWKLFLKSVCEAYGYALSPNYTGDEEIHGSYQ